MSATPTIYFIDDSATMREVIKIAFRRENINVVACHDAALALAEIERTRPDIVITDVIMPDKDGYDVCQFIKNHPELKKIPVVLMSGVVNRAVAEKAFAVKADELLRKPFQPQDLIARVKHLLKPNGTPAPTPAAAASAAAALTSIFSSGATARPVGPTQAPAASQRAVTLIGESPAAGAAPAPARPSPAPAPLPAQAPAAARSVAPPPAGPSPAPATAPVATPAVSSAPSPAPVAAAPAVSSGPPTAPAAKPSAPAGPVAPVAAPPGRPVNGNEAARLRIEIMRLEGLIKKLQSELQAEREYSRSLETHVKSLQETAR